MLANGGPAVGSPSSGGSSSSDDGSSTDDVAGGEDDAAVGEGVAPNLTDLAHPDSVDVFMPPVQMRRFAHLAFAVVTPPAEAPGRVVRHALLTGGNPRVNLAPSSYGVVLLLFENHAARELAMQNAPFLGQEHVVSIEHHEETDNRFHFDHEAFAAFSVKNYPLELWNRERIIFTAGPYANPHLVDPVCIHGNDFSAVILFVKAEDVDGIPPGGIRQDSLRP